MNCMYKLFYGCISFNPTLPKLSIFSIPFSLSFSRAPSLLRVVLHATHTSILLGLCVPEKEVRNKEIEKEERRKEGRK